ncbi:hypothetical protein AXF42_Ash003728 [Apostasia shenzhenica]|uniref:Uncharacterized protein n=1 Tax=Apostasia shenzhenica TaxID=1088818 RepID=A0A2I0AHQ8_9ASPA|nr:hypothetical protein AXF42_Ash003728 [Apostasia shenzhenica]
MANPPTSAPPRSNFFVSSAAGTGGDDAVDEVRLQMLDKKTASSFLESVLWHPSIPINVANAVFLAHSITDPIAPSLKKAVLYRAIASELSLRTVSEKTLENLELIEELDRENGGGPPSETMKAAYCAVAVSCTEVAYNHGVEKFLDAFYRLWVRRIFDLEKSPAAALISKELREVRNIMWEAVKDLEVRELLANNGLEGTLERLRFYLEELYEEMVPPDKVKDSFIDFVDSSGRRSSGELPCGFQNQNPAGVDDSMLGLLSAAVVEEEMEPVDKFGESRVDLRNLGGRKNSREEVPAGSENQKSAGTEDKEFEHLSAAINLVAEKTEHADGAGKNGIENFQGRRKLKNVERPGNDEKNKMDLGDFEKGRNLNEVPSGLENENAAGVEDSEFGRLSTEVSRAEEMEPAIVIGGNQMDLSKFDERRNSIEILSGFENQNANDVENTGLGCSSIEMDAGEMNRGAKTKSQSDGQLDQGDKCEIIREPSEQLNTNDNKGKETSYLDVHRMAKDPLLDGPNNDTEVLANNSKVLCKEMFTGNAGLERAGLPSNSIKSIENSWTVVNETGTLLNKDLENPCSKEIGGKQKESAAVSFTVRGPDIFPKEVENITPRISLMEKNPTAHTMEWSESPPWAERIHLPSPRREAVSPLKLIDDRIFAKRRKIKKWTPIEEEALIKAVKEAIVVKTQSCPGAMLAHGAACDSLKKDA